MEFLKKNKLVAGIVVLAVVVVGGLGVVMLRGGESSEESGQEEQTIKQISPEDIGLELELSSDRKDVILTITKLDGIESIEYELSYDAEETVEGEKSNVPKGAISSEPFDVQGKSEFVKEIFLGTCSAVCRPDKVTSDIKVLVRVNYESGEVGAAEDTLAFENEDN